VSEYWSTPVEGFLREPPKNLARSAYAVEVNPWTRRGDIEAALLFRGAIVSAFGYIDTRLSELALRTSLMPEYIGLRANLSGLFGKRIGYLREVFAKPPLKQFEGFAAQFLDRLEAHYKIRNLCAHAKMQVMPDWGVTFEDYNPQRDNVVSYRRELLLPSELERLAWRVSRLSRLCQYLLGKLDEQIELPSIRDAE